MDGHFQRQQNEIVGDAAPGAFCVALDAFLSALVSRMVSVLSRRLFLLIFISLRSKYSGFGLPPEKRSFCRLRQNEQKGRIAPSGQPDALLAPDEVREIGKTDAPANAPNSRCFRRIGGLSLSPPKAAQIACKPPTGTKGTLGTNRLGVHRFNRHQRHFRHRQKRNTQFPAVGRRCCGGCESAHRNRQGGIPKDSSAV